MKVITLNVNGLRSAEKKGLFDWLKLQDADFICLQETKLQAADRHAAHELPGYYAAFSDAVKKGYSGVAIYAKRQPQQVIHQLGFSISDEEGRFLQFDYDHFSIASIYFPSGSSGEHRQAMKMVFLADIEPYLQSIKASKKPTILCGDINIAHRPIDLKNWKANQVHSGFLPEERAWLDKLFGPLGFVDAFRVCHPEAAVYTWWSFRGRAYEKDVGWRIDYQVITPAWSDKVRTAEVIKTPKFSDHAPLVMEYEVD